MLSFILAGERGGGAVAGLLKSALCGLGKILHVSEDLLEAPENPDFLIFETERVPAIYAERAIVIFLESGTKSAEYLKSDGVSYIVSSEDKEALSLLLKAGIPAIACGLSVHDTLTLSSIGDKSAVVTLSRNLRTLSGKNIGPQDIPLKFGGVEPYAIMAVTAALIAADLQNLALI